MSPMFIRGLWGDELMERHAGLLERIEGLCQEQRQPSPLTVYCFGRENAEFLHNLGYDVVVLDAEPVVDFLGTGNRNPHWRGGHNYGSIMWRHKLEIIRQAVKAFGEIVWLDWDCRLTRRLPRRFWKIMRRGKHLQTALVRTVNPFCRWRPRHFRRRTCDGSFVYCRSQEAAEQLTKLADRRPHEIDQQIFSRYVDQQMPKRWHDDDAYIAAGWEPFCHDAWNHVHGKPDALFCTAKSRFSIGHLAQRWFCSIAPKQPKRRTLIYGMQSSGASWVTWRMFAQDPDTIAIIDLINHKQIPQAKEFDDNQKVVIKATVSLKRSLAEHIHRFKPHEVILVTRDENAIRESLARKKWGGTSEQIEEKLAAFRRILKTSRLYSRVVAYEDVSADPPPLRRTLADILEYSANHYPGGIAAVKRIGGFGAIREDFSKLSTNSD